MTKRVLIRADDLGYSEAVNFGILKTVSDGIIRSVGLMPNMTAAKHGVDLLKDYPVCLGQHTNICVGRPISKPEQIPSLCSENGKFKSSTEYRIAEHDFVKLDEAITEIEAQYERFVSISGQQPHYFEGHAVRSTNFFKALEIVANRHGIPYLGMGFNGPVLFRNTLLYTWLESSKPGYDPFESLKKACLHDYKKNECPMFICHPGYLDHYILQNSSLTIPRTLEVEMACDDEVKSFLAQNKIDVVTYDDLD